MSDSPRTDAVTRKGCGLMVPPAFAQGLEREISKLQGDCDAWSNSYHALKRELNEARDAALKTEMGLRASRETTEAKLATSARQLAAAQEEVETLKAQVDGLCNGNANIADTLRVRGVEGGISTPLDQRVIELVHKFETQIKDLKRDKERLDWLDAHPRNDWNGCGIGYDFRHLICGVPAGQHGKLTSRQAIDYGIKNHL